MRRKKQVVDIRGRFTSSSLYGPFLRLVTLADRARALLSTGKDRHSRLGRCLGSGRIRNFLGDPPQHARLCRRVQGERESRRTHPRSKLAPGLPSGRDRSRRRRPRAGVGVHKFTTPQRSLQAPRPGVLPGFEKHFIETSCMKFLDRRRPTPGRGAFNHCAQVQRPAVPDRRTRRTSASPPTTPPPDSCNTGNTVMCRFVRGFVGARSDLSLIHI